MEINQNGRRSIQMSATNMNAQTNRDSLLVLTVVIALHSSLCVATTSYSSNEVVPTTSISPTATTSSNNSLEETTVTPTSNDSSSENSLSFSFSSTQAPSVSSSIDLTQSILSTTLSSSVNTSVNTPPAPSSQFSSIENSNSTEQPSLDPSDMSSIESVYLTNTNDWSSNSLDISTIDSTIISSTHALLTTTISEGNSNSQGITRSVFTSQSSSVGIATASMTSTTTTATVISGTSNLDTSFTGPSLISSTPALETSSSSLSSINDTGTSINISTINFTTSVEQTASSLLSTDVTISTIFPTSAAPTITNPTSTPTTTTPSPTTQVPTTSRTTKPKYEPIEGNKDTAIFTVWFELVFDCSTFNEIGMKEYFDNTVFLRGVTFKNTTSCSSNGRRKRSTSNRTITYNVTTQVLANNIESFMNETEEALRKLNESTGINIVDNSINNFRERIGNQSYDFCEADNFCPSGFMCKQKNTTMCYFLCDTEAFVIDCGNGDCSVEVNYDTKLHTRKCRCRTDEFYQYEGEKCDTKKMTWQMILAIAGGCAAAIIVILIFIIIITCIRKKRRNNGYNKYSNGSELHYTDLHNRSTTRIYQGLRPTADRGNTGNAQGYENKAYDYRDYIEVDNDLHYRSSANGSRATNGSRAINESHNRDWNPEESADVYAKLNTRFDDVNYQYNIKRAQLRKSSNDTDVRTGF